MNNKTFSMVKCFIVTIILCGLIPASLAGQELDIGRFSNPFKYGWVDEESRLNSRDKLFMRTVMLDQYHQEKQSSAVNALKTAIAPGWGHFSLESYTKGQLFLGVQIMLLGTGLYYREKSMIEFRKYEKATQVDDIKRYYDDAIIPHRQSTLLLSLFFIVWGYTIYDSIIETQTYNWDLWGKISGNEDANLTITPTSITYRF